MERSMNYLLAKLVGGNAGEYDPHVRSTGSAGDAILSGYSIDHRNRLTDATAVRRDIELVLVAGRGIFQHERGDRRREPRVLER